MDELERLKQENERLREALDAATLPPTVTLAVEDARLVAYEGEHRIGVLGTQDITEWMVERSLARAVLTKSVSTSSETKA